MRNKISQYLMGLKINNFFDKKITINYFIFFYLMYSKYLIYTNKKISEKIKIYTYSPALLI